MDDFTAVLERLEQGEGADADVLIPAVYAELRRLAEKHLANEAPGQTLSPTALVHEVYLKLMSHTERAPEQRRYTDRRHFFACAAEAMRRILVDAARKKGALKRGGAIQRSEVDAALLEERGRKPDLLEVDEALGRLEAAHPELAELVKLRYFAGLTMVEAAESMGVSLRTAERNWTYARAWLMREIAG